MRLPPLSQIGMGDLPDDPATRRRVRAGLAREYAHRTPALTARIAFHEAGHVTLLWMSGYGAKHCTLRPWVVGATGCTQATQRIYPSPSHTTKTVAVALAGVVAESIHAGFGVRITAGDRWVLRVALEHDCSPAHAAKAYRRALDRLMRRADVWASVDAVARALIRRTTLDRPRLEQLRTRHEPPSDLWWEWCQQVDRLHRRWRRELESTCVDST